jgi:hypothetical protein
MSEKIQDERAKESEEPSQCSTQRLFSDCLLHRCNIEIESANMYEYIT